MKIIFCALVCIILSACNVGVLEDNLDANNNFVNLNASSLGDPEYPDKLYSPNGINQFVFSTSTNINVASADPKFSMLNLKFYSDSNCNNQVGANVNITFNQNQEHEYIAKSLHTFKNWNYSICANFNGVPSDITAANKSCLDELYGTRSIKYTFVYNIADKNGNIMSNSYCKKGPIGDTTSMPASCTYNRSGTCGYGGGLGSTVSNITIPFGDNKWWNSCSYDSYIIDDSENYWRLNAQCSNATFTEMLKTTLCYGNVSSLNGVCQSAYAPVENSSVCDKSSGAGIVVINSNGHLLCGD